MLDFESGYMSFSVNGSPLGAAFSELGHGSNPQDDAVIPDRFGPSWDSGFFPAITIGIDQSVIWNLGQVPFKHAPVGFIAVSHVDRLSSHLEENRDCILPYDVKQWDVQSQSWCFAKYGFASSLKLHVNQGFFCSLQPSMRISLSIPTQDVSGKPSTFTISSSKTLRPQIWTHCLIKVSCESNSVQFILDGRQDVISKIHEGFIQFNNGPMSFGVMPSFFTISESSESHVWVANVQWSYSLTDQFEFVIPFHHRVLSSLVDHFSNKDNTLALKSMKDICLQVDHPLQSKALEILLSMAPFDLQETLLERSLGLDGVVTIVTSLLESLESASIHNNFDPLLVQSMKTLALLSDSAIGRAVLIKVDAMIRLIALLPLTASVNPLLSPLFFWAEICLANLQIPENSDMFEYYLDSYFQNSTKMDDWVFFKNIVQPFSPITLFPLAWEHMPIGIWIMIQDPLTFIDIARRYVAIIQDLDILASYSRKTMDSLAHWIVSCYYLIAQDGVHTRLELVQFQSSHYATATLEEGDRICFDKSVSRVTIQFDEKCSTRIPQNCLRIFLDANHEFLPPGKSTFFGHGRNEWPTIHLATNEFYWTYKIQTGGDWGFSAHARGEIYGLGETDQLCREILLAGGIEPLIIMAAGGPESSRIIACKALLCLFQNSKISKEVGQGLTSTDIIIDLAISRRYAVTHQNGVILTTSRSSGTMNVIIPNGTILIVDREESVSTSRRRLHIQRPLEYSGWIDSSNSQNEVVVQKVELDNETLKLLGMLSLDKNFRDEFVSRGKMRTLLKLLQIEDIPCHRAVALALDEISGDLYKWTKAASSFEIRFENVDETPVLYSTEDLEHCSWSEFLCSLPAYSGDIKAGMIVEKTTDYRSNTHSPWTTGRVFSVRGNELEVGWGPDFVKEWVELEFVRAIRDHSNRILNYNSSSLSFLIDIESVIPADVILQFKSSQASQTILYEAFDHTRFLGQPCVSENNSLFLDFNCRSAEQLLRTHLIVYVAPRLDSSLVDGLSYENDSFFALIRLMKSSDMLTKVASISALGKLASNMTDSGLISRAATGYRNRLINDNSISEIIASTGDSKSGVVSASAWRALSRILPNMDSLIQLITRVFNVEGEEHIPTVTMTFFAAWFYRLVYSRHRPLLSPIDYQPVVLTTVERTNNEDGFPYDSYQSSHQSTAKFDNAFRLSMSFHPLSRINSLNEEIQDVLLIQPSGTRIHQVDISAAIEDEKLFHFDNTDSIVLDFREEMSHHPQGLLNSPGYSATIVGEYPNFEEIINLSCVGEMEKHFFYMADEIEIIFPESFYLSLGDSLGFYQEDPQTNQMILTYEVVGPFEGPSRHSIRSDRIWFTLKSGSHSHHSTYFHLIACFDQFASDRVIRDHMKQLLPNSLKRRERSGGLHFLLQMLQSNEISVKRWAALAYSQIASVTKPHDLYIARIMAHRLKESQENDQSAFVHEDNIPPVEILYRQGSGLGDATSMAISTDSIIRRQGCLSFARFLHCKGAFTSLVSDTLKVLLMVCTSTYNSMKISDIDTCRHTAWIILQLSLESENLEKMASYGVFESLITCLSSQDRIVKFFAAEALFSLANNSTNRKQLVQTGLHFLVHTATTQITVNPKKMSDEEKDALSLQQGAAKVLCKLVNPLDIGSVVHALDNLVDEAIRLLLLEGEFLLKSNEPIITQPFLDGIELVRQTLESIAVNLGNSQVNIRVCNRQATFEDIFIRLENIFIYWTKIPSISSLLTPISHRLISMCYSYISSQNQLNFIVTRALMTIASTCWRAHGTAIFTRLKNEMKWLRPCFSQYPLDFHKYCLTPALAVLNTIHISEGSYVVLDLLRESNVLAACSSEEEQMILVNQLFFRSENGFKERKGDVNGRQNVAFRFIKNSLEICASTGLHGNIWLSIDVFYRYELRSNVRDYLNSTLRLWDWLILSKNNEASDLFAKYLPFKDLYKCMMWPFIANCANYKNYSTVFCDLMLHLYVCNANFEENSTSDYLHEKSLDQISSSLMQSPRLMHEEEKLDLILLMNDFLGAGRKLSSYHTKRPKDYLVGETLLTIIDKPSEGNFDFLRAESMLNLLKGMVLTGFYDDPSDFQYLQSVLMKATSIHQKPVNDLLDIKKSRKQLKVSSKGDRRKVTSGSSFGSIDGLKIKIYEILLICLELDLLIQLRELDRAKCHLIENLDHTDDGLRNLIVRNVSIKETHLQEGLRVSTSPFPSTKSRSGVVMTVSDNTYDVAWDSHFLPFISESNDGLEANITSYSRESEVFAIIYPRLQFLLVGSQFVDHDTYRNVALTLPSSSSPEIIKIAMKYYLKIHCASHRFFSSLQSVSLGNSSQEDQSFFHLLHTQLPFLKSLTLDDALADSPPEKQMVEKSLQRIRFALEGRTEGIVPRPNMYLCPGPDWRSDSKDSSTIFRVLKVTQSEGEDGYQLIAAERGNSIEHTFSFGTGHCYELALLFPVRPIYRRRQRLTASSKLFPVMLRLLQQQGAHYDENADSFHAIHDACCLFLQSWSRNCDDNLRFIASAFSTYVLAGHVHRSNCVRELLYSATSHDMYISVAPRLLSSLSENIQHSIVSGRMRDALSSLQILDRILPSTKDGIDPSKQNDLLLTQTMLLQYLCNEVASVIPFLEKLSQYNPVEDSGENIISEYQSPYTVLIVGLLAKGIQHNPKHLVKFLNDFKSLSSDTLPLVFMKLSRACFGYKVRAKILNPWLMFMSELCDFTTVRSKVLSDLNVTLLSDIKKYFLRGENGEANLITVESSHPYEAVRSLTAYRIDAGADIKALKIWFSNFSELEEHFTTGEIDYISIIPPLPGNNSPLYFKVTNESGLKVSKNNGFLGGLQQAFESPTHFVIPCGTLLTIKLRKWISNPDGSGNYEGEVLFPHECSGIILPLLHLDLCYCDEKGRDVKKTYSPKNFSGSKFPLLNDELFIPAHEFVVIFHRTGAFSKWGWKLLAKPCSTEEYARRHGVLPSDMYEKSLQDPATRVYETFVNHSIETLDVFQHIEFGENIEALEVVFDDASRLDRGSYITFYRDQNRMEYFGEERYTGRRGSSNWPGCGTCEPLYIDSPSFYYYFHSIPSVDFGFRFSVRPVLAIPQGYEKVANRASAVTIQSQYFKHPHMPRLSTYDFLLSFAEPLFEIDGVGMVHSSHHFLPSGVTVRIFEVQKIDEEIYCHLDTKSPPKSVFHDPIKSYYPDSSYQGLEFSDGNATVFRPPKVSVPFPACLCPITTELCQISFVLEKSLSLSGFSIGLATSTFPRSRSRGFGASNHSWGFICQRRKLPDREIIKLTAMEQGIELNIPLPQTLPEGSRFTIQCSKSECWADIILSSNMSVFRHRFQLPSSGTFDYVVGITLANQQVVSILDHHNDYLVRELTLLPTQESNLWINASRLSFQVPYLERYKVTIPGNGLSVAVDPGAPNLGECLGPEGSVRIYTRETEDFSSLYFTTETENWPTVECPLLVPVSTIYIVYSRILPFMPGFRLLAIPQSVKRDPFRFFSRDPSKHRIIESSHPLTLRGDGFIDVHIPGAYGLFVIFDLRSSIFPSKNFIEFLEGKDSGVAYKGGPDLDIKAFRGDNSGFRKMFPGCGDMPPLRIPTDHFTFHYSLPSSDNLSWGWRFIVFDQSIFHFDLTDEEKLTVGNLPVVTNRRTDDEYFFFFENQTSLVQTIKIDMPVLVGQAYFEIYFGSSSTTNSYSQVGCIVSDPDHDLYIEHSLTIPLTGTPSCLGVGSVIGSYSVGGVTDPTINTYRYCRGSLSNKPCEKMEFKEGSIVGVLMDLDEGRIYYYLDGINVNKDPIFVRDLEISWSEKGGLCPAFSFCPGQLVSINVGQFDFYDDEFSERALIDSYHPRGTALPMIWNIQSRIWEVVTQTTGVLVDVHCIEGQVYGSNVRKLLNRLRSGDIYPLNKLPQLPDLSKASISPTSTHPQPLSSFNIVTTWDPYISDSNVEYTSDFKVAIQKKKSSITYALVNNRRSMITFLIEELRRPPSSKCVDFNAALVTLDYLNSASKGPLGNSMYCWGLFTSGQGIEKPLLVTENGNSVDYCRSLLVGDKVSFVCDLDFGWMIVCINDTEYYREISIPHSLAYYIGVSFSPNCKVRILNEESRALLGILTSLQKVRTSSNHSHEISDSNISAALDVIMTDSCNQRLSSLGLAYYNSGRRVEHSSLKASDIPKPVRWLRDHHQGLIAPSLQLFLQDVGLAEIFKHDDIMLWWDRLILLKAGKATASTPHGSKLNKIHPAGEPALGSDPSVPFLAIVNAATRCDLSLSNEGFVLQVIKLFISLALSIDPLKITSNTYRTRSRKKFDSLESLESEYLQPDAATTLLVIQSTLADIGVVRLLCHILSQVEIPIDLHREVLFLCNFMLLNAINQQESTEDWNVQRIFFDVMLGEGHESGKEPVNVGRAIGLRLEVLSNEISAYRGSQQFGELHLTKQILIFLQRCCGNFLFIFLLKTLDGQYQRAQNYFREVASENEEDCNCVVGTVRLLRVLLEDIPYVDNFIDDSVIFVLDVAGQAYDTLNDMIQVFIFSMIL